MRTLGVIAQKGGTGKTTISVHLAVQAMISGLRVLLIDMDPQGSATAWWKRREDARPELVQANGDSIAEFLTRARHRNYDLVIADTAPHSSADSRICAEQSDHVIIPTRPAILDLDAIGATTKIVHEIRSSTAIVLNACPPPNRYGETRIVSEAREALTVYGLRVCEEAICQRAAFSHALIDGHAVAEFDADGKAAHEIARLWAVIERDLGL